jgi:hypothetical protein
MKKSSAGGKLVRYTAEEIPDATPADLQRLRTVASGPIDTSRFPSGGAAGGRFFAMHKAGLWSARSA